MKPLLRDPLSAASPDIPEDEFAELMSAIESRHDSVPAAFPDKPTELLLGPWVGIGDNCVVACFEPHKHPGYVRIEIVDMRNSINVALRPVLPGGVRMFLDVMLRDEGLPTVENLRWYVRRTTPSPAGISDPGDQRDAVNEMTLVRCGDCVHHVPSPPRVTPVAEWETPSGCVTGRISPESIPAIYPSTLWNCDQFQKEDK